jgi:predicted phage terminase large subunit-like protein
VLDRVISGELTRVIVSAPPQHGKSRLVSAELPAAWLGQRPEDPIITASYSASLAQRNSRFAQRIIRDREYRELYPGIQIDPRNGAVAEWQLKDRRGGLKAAGVGGDATGRGALLAIIDDPHSGYKAAMSAYQRETVWEWYRHVLLQRVWEGGSIVLIMTRWHPDDLAGRLLREHPGLWRLFNYPALAEPALHELKGYVPDALDRPDGVALSPRRFSASYLSQIRREAGSIAWGGQYQGRPVALEGGVIQAGKLEVVDEMPGAIRRTVRFWDLAATPEGASPDPDYTASCKMAQLEDGRYIILHVTQDRLGPGATKARMRTLAESDGHSVAVRIEQEGGSSGKSIIYEYVTMLDGWDVRGETASGPQLLRVMPWASQVEVGRVLLLRGSWVDSFTDEARVYSGDGRTHDDQVVAAAGAYRQLAVPRGAVSLPEHDIEDPDLEVADVLA